MRKETAGPAGDCRCRPAGPAGGCWTWRFPSGCASESPCECGPNNDVPVRPRPAPPAALPRARPLFAFHFVSYKEGRGVIGGGKVEAGQGNNALIGVGRRALALEIINRSGFPQAEEPFGRQETKKKTPPGGFEPRRAPISAKGVPPRALLVHATSVRVESASAVVRSAAKVRPCRAKVLPASI